MQLNRLFHKFKRIFILDKQSHQFDANSPQIFRLRFIQQKGLGLINIMSEQIKHSPSSRSLISSLYSAWEHYKIPAIFYHYTLAVLSKKERKQQLVLMSQQIKRLKAGTHIYHIILNAIQAREESLEIIKRNIHILLQQESAGSLNWSNDQNQIQNEGFTVIFQTKTKNQRENHRVVQLINHLRVYQKVTLQVILSIHQWSLQLLAFNYDGPIQFLYHHQDYLQKILRDTKEVEQSYPQLFQNNPFLLLKREHQFSEFSLVFKNLKFSPEVSEKIQQALQIISNHDTSLERFRILGKFKQYGSRKKILKTESLQKLYYDYNRPMNYQILKNKLAYPQKNQPTVSKYNFLSNRNLLTNPQMSSSARIESRTPTNTQAPKKLLSHQINLNIARSSSLYEIQARKSNQRPTMALLKKLQQNDYSKYLSKKLDKPPSILNKTIRLNNKDLQGNPSEIMSSRVSTLNNQIPRIMKAEKATIIQQQSIQSTLSFIYENSIPQLEIVRYLLDKVFKNKEMSLKDIEQISKIIILQKQYVTLIKVMNGSDLVAWMAVRFLTKDVSTRKAVNILFSYKFCKIPNFQQCLIEQFVHKGYGIVRDQGQIVHQIDMSDKISHQAFKIKYKIDSSQEQGILKDVIKKNICLKESRILKYYYYSKQSKYHKHCTHSQNTCQIGYQFQQAFKVTLSGNIYLRLRCDKISKHGNIYQVNHHLNSTDLLIGYELEQILQFNKRSQIEVNSSFEEEHQKIDYLCLPQCKIMHKYVHFLEKPLVAEYISVHSDIPQILSISADKKAMKNYLVVQKPFIIAIIATNKQDSGKTLAILNFD